jgi:hypothetical protein
MAKTQRASVPNAFALSEISLMHPSMKNAFILLLPQGPLVEVAQSINMAIRGHRVPRNVITLTQSRLPLALFTHLGTEAPPRGGRVGEERLEPSEVTSYNFLAYP